MSFMAAGHSLSWGCRLPWETGSYWEKSCRRTLDLLRCCRLPLQPLDIEALHLAQNPSLALAFPLVLAPSEMLFGLIQVLMLLQ